MAKKISLPERIKELQEYFRGFEVKENLYIVKVEYPDRWGAYPTTDGLINTARAEMAENIWFYYANITEVELDEIFELITDTIETNKSAERKVDLMKEKMYELRELFQDENNTLEKLESLKFVFATDKTKTRKRSQKKTKDIIKEEEPVSGQITDKKDSENND